MGADTQRPPKAPDVTGTAHNALIAGATVVVVTLATGAVLAATAGPFSRAGTHLAILSIAAMAGVLVPGPEPGPLAGLVRAAAVTAAGLIAAWVAAPAPPAAFAGMAAGLGALTLFAGGLKRAAGALAPGRGGGAVAAFLLLTVAGTAPVWLGPAAEAAGSTAVNDWIVAASPLSHLAAWTGYDYLHDTWFYRHSTLGYLRFAYPDAAAGALVLSVAGLILSAIPWRTRED